MTDISVGDPVILNNASKLKKYGLHKGMTGMCNSISIMPGDKEYIWFMPDGIRQSYVIELDRCILDEERLQAMKEEEDDNSTD